MNSVDPLFGVPWMVWLHGVAIATIVVVFSKFIKWAWDQMIEPFL